MIKKILLMMAVVALLLSLAGCYLPTTTTVTAATNFPSGTTDTFTATVRLDLAELPLTANAQALKTMQNPPQPKVCFYQEAHRETLLGCVDITSSMYSGTVGTAKLTTHKLDNSKPTSYVNAYFSDPTGFFASSASEHGAPIWY